ncbi:unnamed protein product [Bursaphelenchus okinawaensis]|uniref:chitin synthase n=1 Tax=Bursaphelenchus okinawaensis TaxID=465554 RepID=A0A811K5U3_9BILA|nr:unnamed protein product [Bursaphelenchus okinawaensis]CAG9093264.1 unnamed protein product [Bursaphelenchus okinawaensis]
METIRVPEGRLTSASNGDESQSNAVDSPNWDIFKLSPPKPDRNGNGFLYESSLQILKVSTYFLLFITTLLSIVTAKTTFLLMTAGIGNGGKNISICTDKIPEASVNKVFVTNQLAVKWVWATLLAVAAPDLLCFVRCFRTMFRDVKRPTLVQFFTVLFIESLNAFGIGTLAFGIFPHITADTAAMLSNAAAMVPAVLCLLSRRFDKWYIVLIVFDVLAISAQSSIFWLWPAAVAEIRSHCISIIVCVIFISCSWWQNYVSPKSSLPPIRSLANFSVGLAQSKAKTYVLVSLWKCCIYIFCIFFFLTPTIPASDLLQKDPFGEKLITITAEDMNQTQISAFLQRMHEYEQPAAYETPKNKEQEEDVNDEVKEKQKKNWDSDDTIDAGEYEKAEHSIRSKNSTGDDEKIEVIEEKKNRRKRETPEEEEVISAYNIYDDYVELNQFTTPFDALWIALIHVGAVILGYHSSKFACKVLIQRVGFALPLSLAVPVTVTLLSDSCERRAVDACYMSNVVSKELFWQCGATDASVWSYEFWSRPQTYIWLGWLVTQVWVCIHLWAPKQERLATSERLFVLSYYNNFFLDQSLAFNRRRDEETKIKADCLDLDSEENQTYQAISNGVSKTPPSICSMASSKMESGLIRNTASSADGITKIYACATLWHETGQEMTCMLKSLFRMDEDQAARKNAQKYIKVVDPDYYEFEAHVLIDDAFEMNDYGEPVINKYVEQFISRVGEAASAVHQMEVKLAPPIKASTPYGGRLVYTLPGCNRLFVHLKDKDKIRHRKRWSQVMYLYYLLAFQLLAKVDDPQRRDVISENTFVLTLDGDVDFKPKCVNMLVDLMKKNRKLGAACGRIHPRGSGPLIWYQKFEYAVGHWLQKATEHMIGCVLCSPGCFSLFRAKALMDDDVTRKYATKAEEPLHYVQYDQGEDRWLCTLLLQRGYRVEYCAASDALTFAPEEFSEFFNQRRRWISSTMANIIDLLSDYKNVVNVNESITIWYIFYQLIMLVSSILGPGTIFLMVVGAVSISFNLDIAISLLMVTVPVVLFCVVCLMSPPNYQIITAEVISAFFAMLMTAVIVGTTLQIQKDGILSPHSIFLFTVMTSFTVSAILHPMEVGCMLPFILYFLAIPCMYMLLPIYSLCNLHIVTWGTREDPLKKKEEENLRKRGHRLDIMESGIPGEASGEISVGCGNVCRVMCCLKPDPIENSPQIWKISEMVNQVNKKMDRLDRKPTSASTSVQDTGDTVDDDEDNELDDEIDMKRQSQAAKRNRKWKNTKSEVWMKSKSLKKAEGDILRSDEDQFWKEMIDKYLQPLSMDPKAQERIRLGLIELRNKSCASFFMVNVVFIIVVLVLQMQKDCIHIEWPLGPKFNHTIIPCGSDKKEAIWVVSRLQLEPIGLVFLVFYMSILVIQFFAMLLHRFGTLEHIIASTDLNCSKKKVHIETVEEMEVEEIVEMVRGLQAYKSPDIDAEDEPTVEEKPISRSQVVTGLRSPRKQLKNTETLDAVFRRRYEALLREEQSTLNKSKPSIATLRGSRMTIQRDNANEKRRNTILRSTINRK